MSAASGGNSEPKQGQRSQSARGFCPRSTMRVPQPDIIEHFGNADAVPQLPERCLSRKAGIVRCCLNNYVQQRLGAWNGDEGDILYQTQQSLYSIASGGLTGLGIGNSRQKHLWLPEASNDFIFSVLCEELGFIGAVICMGLFAALIIQGVIIALNSPDYFGTMLGIGIMSQIAWQTMIHIAVVTNVAPNTGISLPFFSSGGTELTDSIV